MKFGVKDHNSSVKPLVYALQELGHQGVANEPDMILLDHDSPPFYRGVIDQYPDARLVIYPHGEPFAFWWDGMWDTNPRTVGYLASSPGHAEVMRRYGYSKPIHEIGWYLSEIKAFSPAENLNNVLFAPIHPLNNGFMNPVHKAANIAAYQALIKMPIKLTVRHLGNLPSNGLWPVDGVTYKQGAKDGSTDAADLVVANLGTYFTLNVAQGTPCVAYNQAEPPAGGHSTDTMLTAQNWDKYKDYVRYPYDLDDGYPALLAASQMEAGAWKRRFIGEPLNINNLDEAVRAVMNA